MHQRNGRPAAATARALSRWPSRWGTAVDAAASAPDPAAGLRLLVADLGFTSLSCIILAGPPDPTPHAAQQSRLILHWSTLAGEWNGHYRALGLHDADPRVALTAGCLTPILWDAADLDETPRHAPFVSVAGRVGIRSGVAVSFQDTSTRVVVAFDAALSPMTEAGCAGIIASLGDLMLLAAALQERVLWPHSDGLGEDPARPSPANPLTPRERQCLEFASRGLTSGDMGCRLGIAERTVNFHMGNLMRKLEANNRSEAVARAVARGMLQTGTSP